MSIKLKAFVVALILLLSATLGGLVYLEYREEQMQRQHVLALQQQARPYEIELEEVKLDLREADAKFSGIHTVARLVPGAQAVRLGDAVRIREVAERYEIDPVMVLDCAADNFTELLGEAAEMKYEIMLTMSPVDSTTVARISLAREQAANVGAKLSDVFLLRNTDYTSVNIELLSELGFRGFTRYQNEVSSGMTEEGMGWFSYIFYRSTQTSLGQWLSSLVGRSGAMIIVVDMESIHTGTLTSEGVQSLLEVVNQYADEGQLKYSNIDEVLDEIRRADEIAAQRRAEREAYIAEREQRMEELNVIINDIYADWTVDTGVWSLDRVRDFFAPVKRGINTIRRGISEIKVILAS